MANGPGVAQKLPESIRDAGDLMGDPYEISTIRREDYKMVEGPSEYEDLLQCNNLPSSGTSRGHQFPGAFLIEGSGLEKVKCFISINYFVFMLSFSTRKKFFF